MDHEDFYTLESQYHLLRQLAEEARIREGIPRKEIRFGEDGRMV